MAREKREGVMGALRQAKKESDQERMMNMTRAEREEATERSAMAGLNEEETTALQSFNKDKVAYDEVTKERDAEISDLSEKVAEYNRKDEEKRQARTAEISDLSEKVVGKNKADAEKPVDLDLRETRREAMAQAVEALENGTDVWRKRPDGSVQKAIVLRANNGNIEVGYREAGRLNVEKMTPEAFAKNQEVSIDRQMEGRDAEDRGEEIIFTATESLRESAPKIFDQVNKSKWLLATRAGRFLTQGLGSIEILGEKVGEKASALWGAPREVVKNIKESKMIEAEAEQRKLRAATMDFETASHEDEDAMESSAVTAMKEKEDGVIEKGGALMRGALTAIREAGKSVSKDIFREVILGDMELISAIQERVEEAKNNPTETLSKIKKEIMEKAADVLFGAVNAAEDAVSVISKEKNYFDKTVSEENDKLYTAIVESLNDRREKKIEELDKRIAALKKINQPVKGLKKDRSAHMQSVDKAVKALEDEKKLLLNLMLGSEYIGSLTEVEEQLRAGEESERKAA